MSFCKMKLLDDSFNDVTHLCFWCSILGCSKSFESDIYRAVEEPKFLRHFKISSFI